MYFHMRAADANAHSYRPSAAAKEARPRPPAHASTPLAWTLVALATLAAGILRFHALAAKSFWFDECASVAIARLDWYNFIRILWRREGNMSLYYLLLRPWLHFGNSESFIRALSVLFALATFPALYLLGRRLFGSRTGLIAISLLAVNAYHVCYSQEARSYSLMIFLCVLSSLYFLKSLEEPSRRNRITYILVSALAVYAHFFAALLIVVQTLSLRFLDAEGVPDRIRKAWCWIGVLVLPVAIFVATTGAGPLRWVKRPGLKEPWELALYLTGNGGAVLVVAYTIACIGAVLPVYRIAMTKRLSWDAWRYRFVLLWLLLPPLFIFAVSMARPLFLPRYFVFCLPALLLLAAAGLARLRSAWQLTLALVAFLALSFPGSRSYYRQDFDLQRGNWRETSHYLLNNARPGDALIFHVPMGRMPYEYYHSLFGPSAAAPAVIYPRHGDRITFLDFVEKPDYRQIAGSLPEFERVWLVISQAGTPSDPDPTTAALAQLLQTHFPNVEQHDLSSAEVLLYEK